MQSMNLSRWLVLSVSILLSLPTLSFSTDWLQWRGPRRDGITPESDWNPRAILDRSNIQWTKDVGMGHSAVAVKGDRIYTMGNREIGNNLYEDIIWCLDVKTGREIWTHRYECVEGEDPGPGSTPVLEDNRLYTLSRQGHLLCINTIHGELIWSRHLLEENLLQYRDWGFAGSPVVHKDILLLNGNISGIAFDKFTGELLWKSPAGDFNFSTPVLYHHADKDMAVVATNRHLRAFDILTGDVQWTYRLGRHDGDPIILEDKLLVLDGHSALLDLNTNPPKIEWKTDVQWQFQSATVVDGYAYGFGEIDWQKRKQPFICIDIANGRLKWSKTFEIYGASIAAEDKLIILTGQGRLIIAEASPENFIEVASAKIIKMQKDDRSKDYRRQCHCWTHPVLANGKIYARNSFGTLVCVDVSN